jgi:YesN/AraC family two-component response regulator
MTCVGLAGGLGTWPVSPAVEQPSHVSCRVYEQLIARGAGFVDQSHFTRAFKKSKGVTPGQYRRDHGW